MTMTTHASAFRQQQSMGPADAAPGAGRPDVNVGDAERWVSALGGGALAVLGAGRALRRGSLAGAALAAVGGLLVYRGVTGHCQLYQALGIRRAAPDGPVAGNLGVKIDRW
jgi:uncharacterized membrane protein